MSHMTKLRKPKCPWFLENASEDTLPSEQDGSKQQPDLPLDDRV